MASPQTEDGFTAIANELLEAFAKIRINGEARQMLDVIIRKTYGYKKKEDKISTSQFRKLTFLPNHAIHKARKKLLTLNIITVTQKGNSQVLTYQIQKDFTKWKGLPKKVTVPQKGYGCTPKRSQTVPQKGYTPIPSHRDERKKENIQKKELHETIVSFLNEKTHSSFKLTTKTTQREINSRIQEGFTLEDFKAVIEIKTSQWLNDPQMSKFLRPETLFGSKFESYLNESKQHQKSTDWQYK